MNTKKYPLSKTEYGMYFCFVSEPQGLEYNLPFTLKFKKPFDIEKLKTAFLKVISNHPNLKSYFETDEDGKVWRKISDKPIEVEIIKTDNEDITPYVKPFDLSTGPCMRAYIFDRSDSAELLFDVHHIIFDGTSSEIFVKELDSAFRGEELIAEKYSAVDFAVDEQKHLETDEFEKGRRYYGALLDEAETDMIPLPDKDSKEKIPKSIKYILKQTTPDEIRAFSHKNQIRTSALFYSAFGYVLSKYAGSDNSVFSTVFNGRNGEIADSIGMFVKTFPVVCKTGGGKIIDYIREIDEQIVQSRSHSLFSYADICAEMDINPQVYFAYQGDFANTNPVSVCGQDTYCVLNFTNELKVELNFILYRKEGKFEIECEYNSGAYTEGFITGILEALDKAVNEFTVKDELNEVDILSQSQLEILNSFNNTDVPYDDTKTFIDLFGEQVRLRPDKTALVFKENRYTYRELDEITDKIALYLRGKGCGTEDAVAVLTGRSEYMTICSIGVLKSGAAYEPLDPTHPAERLQFMIKDANAKALIADENFLHLVPDFAGDILKISDIKDLPACATSLPKPSPKDLFVLLYTSGSTGTPKGCMITHGNLTNFIHWSHRINEITEKSSSAAYASYGFDAHMMDIYPYLSFGGTEYIIPEENRLDLMWINDYCRENGITNIFMTTQVGRAFMTSIDNIAPKIISTGGETLVPFEPVGGVKFYNLYGPTECTIISTSFLADKYYDPFPIGKPVNNAHMYIVDKNLKRLPVGAVGELCISGPLVSRGYLNRPEQTEKTYVKNPFDSDKAHSVLYHTGDIVKYMNDGNISYVGRRDGMVKIRGYRIELSEVEAVIRDYSGIKDATVVAKDLPTGGKCIVAYIVSDEKTDIDKLKDFIGEKKPYFMIPEAIMQIDSIPLNVNGKVDKRKLPEIKAGDAEKTEETPNRPLNSLETKIVDIIKGITGNDDDINVSADLMRAGMTSLSIIKLAVELNKTFGYDAEIKRLMNGCTVLSLEDDIVEYLLENIGNEKNPSDESDSVKVVKKDYAPLSYTQYGVYSECMKHPGDTFYNIPFFYKFPLSFDEKKLASAVERVLSSHPYIFTRLTIKDDDVVQIKHSSENFRVPVKNMDEKELEGYKKGFVKPYKLMDSQLFKIEIIKTEKGIYLLSDFHHIIFDGGSMGLFIDDLKNCYEGREISAETYDYFDYVNEEIKNKSSEEFKNAEKYVSDMLSECESADELTPDLGGLPENGSSEMVSVPFDMECISKFCTENDVTPAHLFLASVMYVVSRFTNSRNAYINTISNGRSDMRLNNCFGMFVKTLPLGLEIEDISAIELVKSAKDLLINSISNEIYPYADVCRKYNYAPNIMYAYQLGVSDDVYIDNELIENDMIGERKVKFKTGVYIEDNNGQECIDVLYNNAVYSKELMETFANSVKTVTEKIIKAPEQKVRKISMLDKTNAEKIESFSQTEIKEPEIKLLHELFEKQAALHPDKTALVACDGKYTYSQLDKRANIIANSLIARGVKKGCRVVILLERTSRFFASMLGILKAGAAFIPTCPEYPKERIENIIEDSGADFVITFGELLNRYEKTVDIAELENGGNDVKPAVDISPEDLAYLIYTSGSTGKPKGVMLRHIGIASFLTDNKNNLPISYITENCKCYGSVTTISFDLSLKETMGSLCNGITLAFASDDQTMNPMSLAQFFKENNVDAFNSTPSRLLVYMELPEFEQAMKNCKVILSGGEKYPYKLLQVLKEKTDAKIINTYGPTEVTVSSNAKDLTFTDEISVGKPLLNYKEYIVDLDDNKLPAGVTGELIIGGLGVALGYNNLPQQTEKSFIEYEGQRFYRSGDYAKWSENGDVIILGRKDNQVKLRGLRIELGEIEKCLTNIEGVRSAVVVIKKLGNEDNLCAYYTADRQMDIDFLKDELKKTLTEYMIPASFNQLEELPLTPNGKVNLKALSEPVIAEKSKKNIEKPANTAEKRFCKIFADILNIDEVSATDSFFDLGGTSLTVTRVVIEASKIDYSITYGDVFSYPTPRMLAKLVMGSEKGEDGFDNLANYDYGNIENVLAKNTVDSFLKGEKQIIGDVILTGATGFLGIHILYELLKNYNGNVYCMLRGKGDTSARERLQNMFYYYFEENILEVYGKRVHIVDGDIIRKESFDALSEFKADTFINCAANVKHFSKGTDIEDVNYHGVQNILEFCKNTGIRLVHVSTMSVGGMFIGEPGEVTHLKENQLYFGQTLNSKYTNAKFLAEREILENASKGMNVKIMRVGTLAPRERDGEYQINFTTNSFMGRLKSTFLIGSYPYESMDAPFELSPIDYTAKAILLLAQTPRECTVFHPYNNHSLLMNDLYLEMGMTGLNARPVENDEYEKALDEAKKDSEKAKVLSSFIAYENMGHGKKTYSVGKSNAFTMQILYRLGFRWPVTSLDYMKRFLVALKGLDFFE